MRAEAHEQFARLEGEHWWFRGRRRVYLAHLRAALGSVRVRRALDLGGGPGGFARSLAPFAENITALDVEHAALLHARTHARRSAPSSPKAKIMCVAGDARALPLVGRSHDLVTLFDVLEHVDDEVRALREVQRVLRPGGLVVLSVPAYDWLYANNDRVAGHVRRYTRAGLRRALERSGFTVERVTHANVVLFPLIAPTVLMFKLLEALRIVPTTSRHTNLSVPTPKWLAALLYRAFTSELSLAGRFDLPFGHSILAIARAPMRRRVRRRRVQRSDAQQGVAPAVATSNATSGANSPAPAAPLPAKTPATASARSEAAQRGTEPSTTSSGPRSAPSSQTESRERDRGTP